MAHFAVQEGKMGYFGIILWIQDHKQCVVVHRAKMAHLKGANKWAIFASVHISKHMFYVSHIVKGVSNMENLLGKQKVLFVGARGAKNNTKN